jgi:hypothetical protein
MRANQSSESRVEPVMTALFDIDGVSLSGNEHTTFIAYRQERSEPVWDSSVLLERIDREIDGTPRPLIDDSRTKPETTSYRLFDWLSAIGLLLASLAIVITVNHFAF